jgi:hypothetical protein
MAFRVAFKRSPERKERFAYAEAISALQETPGHKLQSGKGFRIRLRRIVT